MKIEEVFKILDRLDKVLSRLWDNNMRSGWALYGEEHAEKTSLRLEAKREMIESIRNAIRTETDCRNDSDSLTVFVKPGNRVATIRTPGRYKDQDTTLIVRISEAPVPAPGEFKFDFKIEYLHTEGSEEVLQETFFCCRPFWYLVQHEQDKLKRFKEGLKKLKDNPETNHLEWSNRL